MITNINLNSRGSSDNPCPVTDLMGMPLMLNPVKKDNGNPVSWHMPVVPIGGSQVWVLSQQFGKTLSIYQDSVSK